MIRGKVIKSTGSWYSVKLEDGRLIECRIKGKFRLEESKYTNPVAVGDWVRVEDDQADNAIIAKIEARKNYILRKSPKHDRARHIIAANIDQAVLIATVSKPRTSSGFIDRFILTAEAYHIPVHIVFNKQDILRPKDLAKQEFLTEIYQKIGYPIHLTSMTNQTGLEELTNVLKNKVTLLAGHSGVGKSTVINAISPKLELKTREISKKHQKGTHTTTFAHMHELDFGGYIIDTPGIKEFGVLDLRAEEVSHYFIEMQPLITECKFNNCLHIDEPKCAVIEALENGEISEERYKNYFNIVMDIKHQKPIY